MRQNLKNKRVLVVGDTIIDKDIFLDAVGLSLESPTLKTNFLHDTKSLGGAANVAKLIGLLGCKCTFMTALSDSDLIQSLDQDFGVQTISCANGRDNIKCRYWVSRGGSTYKYLQINDCGNAGISHEDICVGEYDAILLCDYRCGFVTDSLVKNCMAFEGTKFVSSQMSDRGSNMNRYVGFDCAIMNEKESSCCNVCFPTAVVTLAERGSRTVLADGTVTEHKGFPVRTENVIGAGDAFCAAYVCTENGEFANRFASSYISLTDRTPCSLKEMINRE